MSDVRAMPRRQVVEDRYIGYLEDLIRDIRNGDVVEVFVVMNDAALGEYRAFMSFEDRIRALGYLEHIKRGVSR